MFRRVIEIVFLLPFLLLSIILGELVFELGAPGWLSTAVGLLPSVVLVGLYWLYSGEGDPYMAASDRTTKQKQGSDPSRLMNTRRKSLSSAFTVVAISWVTMALCLVLFIWTEPWSTLLPAWVKIMANSLWLYLGVINFYIYVRGSIDLTVAQSVR